MMDYIELTHHSDNDLEEPSTYWTHELNTCSLHVDEFDDLACDSTPKNIQFIYPDIQSTYMIGL